MRTHQKSYRAVPLCRRIVPPPPLCRRVRDQSWWPGRRRARLWRWTERRAVTCDCSPQMRVPCTWPPGPSSSSGPDQQGRMQQRNTHTRSASEIYNISKSVILWKISYIKSFIGVLHREMVEQLKKYSFWTFSVPWSSPLSLFFFLPDKDNGSKICKKGVYFYYEMILYLIMYNAGRHINHWRL